MDAEINCMWFTIHIRDGNRFLIDIAWLVEIDCPFYWLCWNLLGGVFFVVAKVPFRIDWHRGWAWSKSIFEWDFSCCWDRLGSRMLGLIRISWSSGFFESDRSRALWASGGAENVCGIELDFCNPIWIKLSEDGIDFLYSNRFVAIFGTGFPIALRYQTSVGEEGIKIELEQVVSFIPSNATVPVIDQLILSSLCIPNIRHINIVI